MSPSASIRTVARWLAAGIGLAAGAYATYVGVMWCRYGHVRRPVDPEERDELLDRFMPSYEVAERHCVRVAAPAAITLAAAREADLFDTPLVRAIFKGRELLLGAAPDDRHRSRGMLAEVQALGWRVLVEVPGRELVVGAVTKPWEPNVTFHGLPPAVFAGFDEPGYVKIVWTLRADPIGERESVFRTETRAVATDPISRATFRRYWAFLSPGIILIRRLSLAPLKRDAERRAREGGFNRQTAPRVLLPAAAARHPADYQRSRCDHFMNTCHPSEASPFVRRSSRPSPSDSTSARFCAFPL
jgi:hypothetical protein